MTALRHTVYPTIRECATSCASPGSWPCRWPSRSSISSVRSPVQKVVEIPGSGTNSYITFLMPGIVVMSAMFAGGWSGMGVIDDLDRGVMDRFLVAPTSRGAIMLGRVTTQVLTILSRPSSSWAWRCSSGDGPPAARAASSC